MEEAEVTLPLRHRLKRTSKEGKTSATPTKLLDPDTGQPRSHIRQPSAVIVSKSKSTNIIFSLKPKNQSHKSVNMNNLGGSSNTNAGAAGEKEDYVDKGMSSSLYRGGVHC